MEDSVQLLRAKTILSTMLSINPRGPTLCSVMSHCGENQNGLPSERFTGDKKIRSGGIFIIVGWLCSHTANTHLCPNTI